LTVCEKGARRGARRRARSVRPWKEDARLGSIMFSRMSELIRDWRIRWVLEWIDSCWEVYKDVMVK